MVMIVAIILLFVIIVGVLLDVTERINIINRYFLAVYMIIYPNIITLLAIIKVTIGEHITAESYTLLYIVMIMGIIYTYARLNIFPYTENKEISQSLVIMRGGIIILYCSIYAIIVQSILLLTVYDNVLKLGIDDRLVAESIIYSMIILTLLTLNGMIRILLTTTHYTAKKKTIYFFLTFVPIVNLFVMLSICKNVYDEFDYSYQQQLMENVVIRTDACKTKYPLLLVSGISFRDLRFFNYWGRIPFVLLENGATIQYCHDRSFGTINDNATLIKNRILEIINETGCKKVNIIAHGKGGLDARYAIAMYGIEEYVASLTTINTPHRGMVMSNILFHMPGGIIKSWTRYLTKKCQERGEIYPEVYTCLKQLTKKSQDKFNEVIKDKEGIYYQSYSTVMKSIFGRGKYALSHLITLISDGANDGLVSVKSARWGEFQGVLGNRGITGITYNDSTDYDRRNHRGYDICSEYVNIVGELKIKRF
ncbi:MAG: triacylglycerol lipase [Lachnospiraceae bacterium]|nr:triacylglycerol lipase [Lachnospiraceae bacterium]